jgi:hypothetical protein
MAEYTRVNLKSGVQDMAPKFGMEAGGPRAASGALPWPTRGR